MITRRRALAVGSILFFVSAAYGAEIKVMTSGAFTAAYLQLVPEFERTTHNKVLHRLWCLHGRCSGLHSKQAAAW